MKRAVLALCAGIAIAAAAAGLAASASTVNHTATANSEGVWPGSPMLSAGPYEGGAFLKPENSPRFSALTVKDDHAFKPEFGPQTATLSSNVWPEETQVYKPEFGPQLAIPEGDDTGPQLPPRPNVLAYAPIDRFTVKGDGGTEFIMAEKFWNTRPVSGTGTLKPGGDTQLIVAEGFDGPNVPAPDGTKSDHRTASLKPGGGTGGIYPDTGEGDSPAMLQLGAQTPWPFSPAIKESGG